MLCIPECENGWGWRKLREASVEQGKEKTKEGGLHGGAKPSDGRGKLKHYERSNKEVLATSIPRAAKEKVAGAKVLDRGKGRWQRDGTVNHAHGRASVECQSWEMQRKLLEMQGQLRALQKDMATIVAFVGSLKESQGTDKLKDDGPSFTRKKAQQKGKYNKGWNVWRRAKSQEHFGAGPSDVKAHGIEPQPKAHSGGSLSKTQLNGSGSRPTELAKPSSSPIHSIELHGLGFMPDNIQTAPTEVVGSPVWSRRSLVLKIPC
ncbi:uncharacterized protein LOC121240725 [Juglans microcarpa x Juglans regia]|uniref:uncharacterized protein LOC121240725 n=1 Tax=Juglans microcarpa x Juglans regia TaxID=2249226 RepID=UPI001B7DB227|nr:uncharacterized protein LOC121240725 [Juglans microcarpa x Juglans regia]